MTGMEVNGQGLKCVESHIGDGQVVSVTHGIENGSIASHQTGVKIDPEYWCKAPNDLPRRLDFHKSPERDFIEDNLCVLVGEGLTIFLITQRGSKSQLFQDRTRLRKVTHLGFVLLLHFELSILMCWRFLIRDKIASVTAQA